MHDLKLSTLTVINVQTVWVFAVAMENEDVKWIVNPSHAGPVYRRDVASIKSWLNSSQIMS